jgi:hypothetical protein
VAITELEDKRDCDLFVEQVNDAEAFLEYDWKRNPPKVFLLLLL